MTPPGGGKSVTDWAWRHAQTVWAQRDAGHLLCRQKGFLITKNVYSVFFRSESLNHTPEIVNREATLAVKRSTLVEINIWTLFLWNLLIWTHNFGIFLYFKRVRVHVSKRHLPLIILRLIAVSPYFSNQFKYFKYLNWVLNRNQFGSCPLPWRLILYEWILLILNQYRYRNIGTVRHIELSAPSWNTEIIRFKCTYWSV